ncbi:hypothetical protein [Vermiculatibacterium agrestimuris]|uniref:hypothetical protein n=1 Tax=Vermiculatibacterium agrestimuris TaxID=2941519 RepID=UPI00203D39D0|nr:hypothetical protein [Vermiculatibacterium agrestimuris]
MLSKIENELKKIKEIDPNWAGKAANLDFDSPELRKEKWGKRYFALLNQIQNGIKQGEIEKEAAIDLFDKKLQKQVDVHLQSLLRPYLAFAKIRELEKENLLQVKYMIDIIWEQYVLRFNPELTLDMPGDIAKEELTEIGQTLGAAAFTCVERNFSYEGILTLLKKNLMLSDGLTEYLAKKFDQDFKELRINYLIRKLR